MKLSLLFVCEQIFKICRLFYLSLPRHTIWNSICVRWPGPFHPGRTGSGSGRNPIHPLFRERDRNCPGERGGVSLFRLQIERIGTCQVPTLNVSAIAAVWGYFASSPASAAFSGRITTFTRLPSARTFLAMACTSAAVRARRVGS